MRTILKVITALAGVGLLAGLGVLFFGSPDDAAHVPSSALITAAVTTLAGAIFLKSSKQPDRAGQKSQSMLTTVVFAILVVIAALLVGFVVTNH